MNKLEFETKLNGGDISFTKDPFKENQQIKSIECVIKWHIDPTGGSYGIKFWNLCLNSFRVEMVVEDIDTQEEESVIFDSFYEEYELDINTDDYRMKDDFIITEIEIDKNGKSAIAYIQKHIN